MADLFPKKGNKAKDKETSKAVLDEKLISGNLDKDYKFNPQESDLVHFYVTDFAAPRPADINENFTAPKRLVKTPPHLFVQQFKDNYEANGAFINVNTPGKILAILKNVDEEAILEAYGGEILSATQNDPRLKRKYVKDLLKRKRKLRLSGANRLVEFQDVKHVPENYDGFPFDIKELKEIPQSCLFVDED